MHIDRTTGALLPTQRALFFLALLAALGGVAHAAWPDRVDEKTVLFLALAAVITVLPRVKALAIGDKLSVEFLDQLAGEVAEAKQTAQAAVAGVVEVEAARPEAGARVAQAGATTESIWDVDPHKGFAGGRSEANSRRLSASITPVFPADHPACRVHLEIRSTDPRRPLQGEVVFHLHPTFIQSDPVVAADREGVAQFDLLAWGAFTVGAEADGGSTRLELDLAEVPGGTRAFYEN